MNSIQLFRFFKLAILFLPFTSCQVLNVDVLIQNGTVYDGLDTLSKSWSVGIIEDKIVFAGEEKGIKIEAKETIDATGMVVCPGFIDPHTHADRDLNVPEKSHNLPFLMQGITTVVAGNDGSSFYPISEFKARYEKQGIGTNAVLLTGHGTLRKKVLGKSDRFAGEEEVEKMKLILQKEMKDGSFGLSTGLFYAPGSYSNTEEVIELAKVASEMGGIYDSHLRDESSYTVGLIPAVEEAIEIGRQAKLPIHISHIKCLGVDVWGQSKTIVEMVETAQKEGIDVTANQYPYDASATDLLSAVVPRWAESGGSDSLFYRYGQADLKEKILADTRNNIRRRGGGEKLLVVYTESDLFVGKNLKEIAEDLGLSEDKAVFEILKQAGYVRVASFNMNPNDIKNFMSQPWVVPGSDGNTGHPRKYGTYPRMFHKYISKEKVMSVGTFIKKSTSVTAGIYQIPNRGQLKKDFYADIIIFDPAKFKDIADFKDAFQYAEGLQYSIINGKISVKEGQFMEQLNGKVLLK